MVEEALQELAKNLEELTKVINDHEFRDRDQAGHLAKLKECYEAVRAQATELEPHLDARLNHFLAQSSYAKALEWIYSKYLKKGD